MDSNQAVMAPAEAGKVGKRTPRSVRFHDPEWERIEAFAEKRGMAAAECVRVARLDAIEVARRLTRKATVWLLSSSGPSATAT